MLTILTKSLYEFLLVSLFSEIFAKHPANANLCYNNYQHCMCIEIHGQWKKSVHYSVNQLYLPVKKCSTWILIERAIFLTCEKMSYGTLKWFDVEIQEWDSRDFYFQHVIKSFGENVFRLLIKITKKVNGNKDAFMH